MNKFRIHENEHGFFIDYIYSDSENKKCLRLSEDNDYFSFTILSQQSDLQNKHRIKIDISNPLFLPIKKLLEGNAYIEILEEGSNENKTLTIINNEDTYIDLIFSLPQTPISATSISITNIRLASPEVTFSKDSPTIQNFKNKLHNMFIEIKQQFKETTL